MSQCDESVRQAFNGQQPCIIGEKCNCVYNQGKCVKLPKPETIPCAGTVCWNYTLKQGAVN